MGCGATRPFSSWLAGTLNSGGLSTIEGRLPCVIPEPHLRGITLEQLRKLFLYAQTVCRTDHWTRLGQDQLQSVSRKGSCGSCTSCGSYDSEGPDHRGGAHVGQRSMRTFRGSSPCLTPGAMAPPATPSKAVRTPTGCFTPGPGSSMRSSKGAALDATSDEFDLYALVEIVIKPVTKDRECSYVEFTSEDPWEQIPCWFVSHYWGEPVKDFISCLSLFYGRHSLKCNTPSWICAYALRQHQLDQEIGTGDPMEEPFAKALASAHVQGTAVILDDRLTVYKRAWCCFETVLTILLNKRLDLVVTHSHKPYMIADGLARGDTDAAMQEARDQEFPLEVAEKGMEVTIELSTTSQAADKNRILNAIATSDTSNETPPLFHPNYEFHNAEIRKKFAAVMLRVATANGDADGVRRALHRSPAAQYVWRSADGQTQQEVAEALAQRHHHDQERRDIVAYFREASRQASRHCPGQAAPPQQSPGARAAAPRASILKCAGPHSPARTQGPVRRASIAGLGAEEGDAEDFDAVAVTHNFTANSGGSSNSGHTVQKVRSNKSQKSEKSAASGKSEKSAASGRSLRELRSGDTCSSGCTFVSKTTGMSRCSRMSRSAAGAIRAAFSGVRKVKSLTNTKPLVTLGSWGGSDGPSTATGRGDIAARRPPLPTYTCPELDGICSSAPVSSLRRRPGDEDGGEDDGASVSSTSSTPDLRGVHGAEAIDPASRPNSAVFRYIDKHRRGQNPKSAGSKPQSFTGARKASLMLPDGSVVQPDAGGAPDAAPPHQRHEAVSDANDLPGSVADPGDDRILESAMHLRRSAADKASGVDAVLQWMKENERTEEAQEEGCRLLAALLVAVPGALQSPEGGLVEAISEAVGAAMSSHPASWRVQVEACRAIWHLAGGSEERRQRVQATRLAQALATTMRTHGKSKHVWVEAALAHRALWPPSDGDPGGDSAERDTCSGHTSASAGGSDRGTTAPRRISASIQRYLASAGVAGVEELPRAEAGEGGQGAAGTAGDGDESSGLGSLGDPDNLFPPGAQDEALDRWGVMSSTGTVSKMLDCADLKLCDFEAEERLLLPAE